MTNTAKILNFGRGNFAEQELRVADIDDGYTRFANELLEAIASADLTARQLKVMLAYVRKTYGFNKKTDRIADEQIAQLTGLSRQNVNKAKKRTDFNELPVYGWKSNRCKQGGICVAIQQVSPS
ncbi:replication protein o [Escherichia coli]|nr:replication protein o [Escherichia coli]